MPSYESRVFKQLSLPSRVEVIRVLLQAFLKHGGFVKEFGAQNQEFVDELADSLGLSQTQRSFRMQTVVRKEGRLKTFPAWHRLLFRAADAAAKERLLIHPTETLKLGGKREWMLTEKGIDKALALTGIPIPSKQELPIITYEVQKAADKLQKAHRRQDYDPVDPAKKIRKVTIQSLLRTRGFRQAIVQAYDHRCSVCGLKIASPDSLSWEVEAAHIVPHRFYGKDDIWNGIALCRFHHWSFDVGWFTLREDFTVEIDNRIHTHPSGDGLMGSFDILRQLLTPNQRIKLPQNRALFPHENSISWHRKNIFTLSRSNKEG